MPSPNQWLGHVQVATAPGGGGEARVLMAQSPLSKPHSATLHAESHAWLPSQDGGHGHAGGGAVCGDDGGTTTVGGGGDGGVHTAYEEAACAPSARMQPAPCVVTHMLLTQPSPVTLPWVHDAEHAHAAQ